MTGNDEERGKVEQEYAFDVLRVAITLARSSGSQQAIDFVTKTISAARAEGRAEERKGVEKLVEAAADLCGSARILAGRLEAEGYDAQAREQRIRIRRYEAALSSINGQEPTK